MASAKREPIVGVWGGASSGVQGQSPWSGGQFPKAGTLFAFRRLMKAANLPTFLKFKNTENHRHLCCLSNFVLYRTISPPTFIAYTT